MPEQNHMIVYTLRVVRVLLEWECPGVRSPSLGLTADVRSRSSQPGRRWLGDDAASAIH
jgi:hypothetical protein